jgi:sec-independent protein translocase protein TatA
LLQITRYNVQPTSAAPVAAYLSSESICATIVDALDTSVPAAGRILMGELFTPTHLIVLAVVAVVLFGGKKLPELGKGLGEGLRGFKDGMKGVTEDVNKPGETAHTVTPKAEEQAK